jgi:hypothetical protein
MGKGLMTAVGAQVGQSTPGTQALFGMAAGRGRAVSRRKRAKTSRRVKARAPKRRKRAGKARLVKGSRAAKAYMAKIRRKRKR